MIYLYEIKCKTPNHLYIGITANLFNRIKAHRTKKGSIFTKKHGFDSLFIIEVFYSEGLAKRAEHNYVILCKKQFKNKIICGAGWTNSNYRRYGNNN